MKRKISVENRQLLYLSLAFLCMIIIKVIPFPDALRIAGGAELTASGQTSLAVLAFALILWMTEAVPFHITGLMSIILLTLFRTDSFINIVALGFGNNIV
ncbi:MAG: SLC13 family permease, partial [Sphaerochaetaceae bacterium]